MTTVHLVHGFNVSDGGKKTVAILEPYITEQSMKARVFSYGWLGLMGVYYLNPRIVKQLISRVKEGDSGIGHSNGCVIIHMAAFYGAPFKNVAYLNPALNSNVPLAPQIEKASVFYNDGDNAVKVATWLRELMPWAPLGDPVWGDMGARGYQPGKYIESTYKPEGIISKIIHTLNLMCIKHRVLLYLLRVLIAPLAIIYWLFLGPIEVIATFYINNIKSNNPDALLDIKRIEDKRFVINAFIIPALIWSIVSVWAIII